MALEGFSIRQISYRCATKVIIKNHYLHRRAPCSFAFGLFNKRNQLKCVCIYGTPSSSPLRKGIAGEKHKNNVIELTRLWVSDIVPKNGESFLIGRTLPLIDKEIVVSFAEIQQGHIGIVYQATNWIYTGLSAKRTNYTIEGVNKHCQTIADKYTSKELKKIYGKKFTLVDRPRKHRYIFIRGNKKRKREILKDLRYPILPYPKRKVYTKPKRIKLRIVYAKAKRLKLE